MREQGKNEYPLIERKSIKSTPNDLILICSGNPSSTEKSEKLPRGVDFLKKYEAWGFLKPPRRSFDFLALYVTSPESEVKYIAEVKGIFDPSIGGTKIENYSEYPSYEEGKRVIKLKNIKKLKDPIPYKKIAIQHIKYVDMKTFKNAKTTLDLFSYRALLEATQEEK